MEIKKILATIPLFKGLTDQQYDDLAMIVVDQEFGRGRTIFAEGEEGVGFYVVISGLIKIYKLSPEGKEQILHVFGPGEPFAEAAVFAGSAYPAHALALQPSRLFFLPRNSFRDLIMENPSLAMNMMAALSHRLKRFAHMIEDLSLKEVPGRLAAHLLDLSSSQEGADQVVLQIAKAHLASLLGTIPETLSRILTRMQKQGLIEMEGQNIRLIDRESLEELAAGERRLG
ncbi:MAG: Crp/Fnr family transcriptional regulator [Desulfobulbaceae bacterium]|nr:Crp/Fnr family transcriptional regulator [Desulfobulbaceae bacterium]